MFNLFSKLKPEADSTEVEMTPEEIAAQEKADRIAFHRANVRNGPVSWKTTSAGQVRRAQARATQREIKKNFRREVKGYFERQRVAAILRPHLQTIGLVPTATGRQFSLHDEVVSTAWIVQRYGRETEVDGVKTGHVSFLYDDVLAAIKTAAAFYESATGYPVRVPADFELAIYAEVGA